MAEAVTVETGDGLSAEWDGEELTLAGEPDWDQLESVRLIGGSAGDLRLAVVVVRPRGGETHGDDRVVASIAGPEGPVEAEEVLVSTEYDSEARVRRLGLEIWTSHGISRRVAADRSGEVEVATTGGFRSEKTPLELRLEGGRGSGSHEKLEPA